jgi:hypothetical protein
MRDCGLAAFPRALALLAGACGCESRPGNPYAVEAFAAQGREHLPPEGF